MLWNTSRFEVKSCDSAVVGAKDLIRVGPNEVKVLPVGNAKVTLLSDTMENGST